MMYADDIFLSRGEIVSAVFDTYMADLLRGPLWSPNEPSGRRIPFKGAETCKQSRSFEDEFSSPGCYMFGVGDRILYVGRTSQTLWRRLRGRYFIGRKTQHAWAVEYEQQLIEHGIDGFPGDVVDQYKKSYHGSTVRLDGAVAFARAGVNDVWFHLLPTRAGDIAETLEPLLIDSCNVWNARRGFDRMLNKWG